MWHTAAAVPRSQPHGVPLCPCARAPCHLSPPRPYSKPQRDRMQRAFDMSLCSCPEPCARTAPPPAFRASAAPRAALGGRLYSIPRLASAPTAPGGLASEAGKRRVGVGPYCAWGKAAGGDIDAAGGGAGAGKRWSAPRGDRSERSCEDGPGEPWRESGRESWRDAGREPRRESARRASASARRQSAPICARAASSSADRVSASARAACASAAPSSRANATCRDSASASAAPARRTSSSKARRCRASVPASSCARKSSSRAWKSSSCARNSSDDRLAARAARASRSAVEAAAWAAGVGSGRRAKA
eukprot:scaffold21863_cov112-Isochrysis_galbana.AAC.3